MAKADATNRIQSPAAFSEFTNKSRQLALVGQTTEPRSRGENEDDHPQYPNEDRKRTSGDFPLHPKKRNRSLTCNDPACHNRTFADEPNLNRHLREVHGQAQYHCPIKTCERHMRGFKRRDNCINHQKRSHGNLKSFTISRDGNTMRSRDSSLHVTQECDASSSPESEERETEQKIVAEESEIVMQKMDALRTLMKKKKRVEEDIDKATAELQQALQRDVNREEQ